MREERFHVLPHPEVEEYVRRKGDNVDRWLIGMQRLRRKSLDGAEKLTSANERLPPDSPNSERS